MFRFLGKWSRRFGTPAWALALQGSLGLTIVFLARSFIDTILYTAPVVWLFFLATAGSVFILRFKEPHIQRPFKVPFYPVVTIIFCAASIFMLYNSITYAYSNKRPALIIVVGTLFIGLALYAVTKLVVRMFASIKQNPKS
jgi:amino acid transporter